MHPREGKVALRIFLSKRATALPVSFLILFVSLTMITVATYYVSVAKIQARGQLLNVALAKQSMLSFDDSVQSATWSPSTTSIYTFEDFGGTFKTNVTEKWLLINVTDGIFYDLAFNGNIGKAVYELPPTGTVVSTLYLRGDRRAVINETAYTTAQIYLSQGMQSPEVTLTYRPLATIGQTGYQEKPVNTLRLYIISLNQSAKLTARGDFHIKTTCLAVVSNLRFYNITYPITTISVKTALDGRVDTVNLPVASNSEGAHLRVETLICHVRLERI